MELYKYLAKSEFATAIINIWYILMSGSNIKCWHVNAGNRFCLWKSVTISSLTSSTVALAKFIKSSVFSTGKKNHLPVEPDPQRPLAVESENSETS